MVEKSYAAGLWPSLYEPLRTFGHKLAEYFTPRSDASANEEGYRITLELPGVSEDDIEVIAENGVVTVKGEKKFEREDKGDTWYFSEREYGTFSRSFRLPGDADESNVSAELKDGVLTITVPRIKPQEPETKKVKIKKG